MSWESDKHLIRTQEPGWYNLAIGEPYFLQWDLSAYYPDANGARIGYPTSEPEPELKVELEKLHPGKLVVVTVGAKQALYAAIYAWKQRYPGTMCLNHHHPFWPTYPTVARLSGLDFIHDPWYQSIAVNVITAPNNPDGSNAFAHPGAQCDIWDAAYATTTYGWYEKDHNPKHKMAVWSAAKMLGLSGARVGWLTTEDPELAASAAQFVEQTTSGAPTNGQHLVAGTLSNLGPDREKRFWMANKLISTNAQLLGGTIKDHAELEGYHRTGMGMFSWVRPYETEKFNAALNAAKIRVVPGVVCGKPGYVRISLGLKTLDMMKAMDALTKELR